MLKTTKLIVMAFSMVGVGANLAAAADLTGEWRGKVRCKVNDGMRRSVPDHGATVRVSQVGRQFVAQLEDAQGVRRYNGEVVSQLGREHRFEAILIECRSTATLSNYSEKAFLRGTVQASGGRISGESLYRNQFGAIGSCRWRLQRSSAVRPNLAPCN